MVTDSELPESRALLSVMSLIPNPMLSVPHRGAQAYLLRCTFLCVTSVSNSEGDDAAGHLVQVL